MTRNDYEILARALRSARISVANGYPIAATDAERERDAQRIAAHAATCAAVAYALAATNPRFKQAKFLEACGVTI